MKLGNRIILKMCNITQPGKCYRCVYFPNAEDQDIPKITLPVVLCGCEKWFLTLREEHKLQMFENYVLGNISETMKTDK
jgi:hypothetical protein